MTGPRPDTAPGAVLRAMLSLLTALALALFVAPAAPEGGTPGGGHRAWLVAAPSGLAGLHQRETALRQSIAPQAEPLALPPPQGLAPRDPGRWTRSQGSAPPPGASRHDRARPRARAPPTPFL